MLGVFILVIFISRERKDTKKAAAHLGQLLIEKKNLGNY
jgi:hypothetical protein